MISLKPALLPILGAFFSLLTPNLSGSGLTDPLDKGLVINEVHYDAEDKTQFIEFVELLNTMVR